MPSFSPGADQIEARERLEALVEGALAKLAAGALPDRPAQPPQQPSRKPSTAAVARRCTMLR